MIRAALAVDNLSSKEFFMPRRNLSAEKRVRQSAKRRLAHRAVKTYIKNRIKEFRAEKDEARRAELLRVIYSALDKAVKRGIYHPNTVARKKSRLASSSGK